ncbi:AraC family transcriptional regulator [Alkalihalobacillus trypoxylicola]|uniref:AraC family transcriptional regulator n=1 Tax=Alkalihalobacillus trypoxylicola TaxID=519424 RepID=A0A161PJI0_9BACI|nr:AraC family transcriptional regulator [Alkalihalobacillus trypoxylicola]KYG29461.1 AraC family transcriptional regulator [Alkalihalobacillus trypoxylicola]
MNWIHNIQSAIDYMEENLLEDIKLDKVAEQANSSLFHFQRTFALLTDCSVSEYIRRRRLSLAAEELSSSKQKVIDIALKYGYDTPESFSKAFRKQHGVAPSEAMRYRGKLKFYDRLIIQVILKGAEPVKYNIVEKESFKAVGIKKTYSLKGNENLVEIPKLWQEVNHNGTVSQLFELNNGGIKGVLGICDDLKVDEQLIDYWVAVESTMTESDLFQLIDIPASKWVVFEVSGPMPEAMQNTWKKIFSEWFPTSDYEHAGTPEMEVYPEDGSDKTNFYSEIWIPIKSKK